MSMSLPVRGGRAHQNSASADRRGGPQNYAELCRTCREATRREAAGIHILSVSFQGLLRHPIQGAPELHACCMARDEMSSSPVDVVDHPSELSTHTPENSSLLSPRRISSNAVMDVALRQPDPFYRELTRWIRRLRCCKCFDDKA